ncbi:MAG: helix-turn-helix transcriptional regulator, partial [Pseudomonadota bacterium]
FAIPRRSDAAPLMVEVAPLKDSAAELDLALEGAMVTLIDPASVPPINIKRFAAAYGLTAAESAVCTLLLAGCTIPEVAERRGTSPVTVKNQAGAIMAKAGVGRRSDLVRLILRVLPPVT